MAARVLSRGMVFGVTGLKDGTPMVVVLLVKRLCGNDIWEAAAYLGSSLSIEMVLVSEGFEIRAGKFVGLLSEIESFGSAYDQCFGSGE